jgi:tetratricopeptide (TPR) repeat protein
MELLEGETLSDRLRREGRLAEPAAAPLVAQIASGLAAAHAEGVVHRDLKPSNVMLVPVHGGGERAVVTDFGIARAADGFTSGTTWEGPLGTPAYMAPEQATGGPVTPATDLYSLGVLMYELTTGTLPPASDTTRTGAFKLLGGSSLGRRRPTPRASKRWRELIRWCLVEDPAQRAQSAEALLRALQPGARSQRWPFRKVLWALALTSAALAAVMIAPRFGQGDRGLRPPAAVTGEKSLAKQPGPLAVVVADLENTTGDPQLDTLSGLLVTSLEQSRALSLVTRASLLDRLRDLGRDPAGPIDETLGRELVRRVGAQLLIVGTVTRFGETYAIDLHALEPGGERYLFTLREKGAGKGSIPDLLDRLSERVRRSVSEPLDEVKASRVRVSEAVTSNLEAYRHFFDGKQLQAQGRYGEALAEYRRAIAVDPTFAMAHLAIVEVLETKDAEGARVALEAAQRYAAAAPERERLIIRAYAAASELRFDEAIEIYEEVQRRFPTSAEAFARCASLVALFKGDTARALGLLRKAADLEPGRTPQLVQALILARQYDEASQLAERFASRNPGPESFRVLSAVHGVQGKVLPALETARKATAAGVPLEGTFLHAYLRGGALDEAETSLRKMIAAPESPLSDRRTAYVSLATVLGYEGRWREAFGLLEEAIQSVDGGAPSLELLWNRTFLSGGLGADAVRSGTEKLLPVDYGWAVCAAGILAYLGETNPAARVLAQVPTGPRESPCGRITEAVIAFRRGRPSVGIERMQGINFGTEQLYLGAMLLESGRTEAALEALDRFARQTQGWLSFYAWGAGEAAYLRAIALDRLGRRGEALEAAEGQLQIWARADPGHPALRRMRDLAGRWRAQTP